MRMGEKTKQQFEKSLYGKKVQTSSKNEIL